jgi:hypothetical protein
MVDGEFVVVISAVAILTAATAIMEEHVITHQCATPDHARMIDRQEVMTMIATIVVIAAADAIAQSKGAFEDRRQSEMISIEMIATDLIHPASTAENTSAQEMKDTTVITAIIDATIIISIVTVDIECRQIMSLIDFDLKAKHLHDFPSSYFLFLYHQITIIQKKLIILLTFYNFSSPFCSYAIRNSFCAMTKITNKQTNEKITFIFF